MWCLLRLILLLPVLVVVGLFRLVFGRRDIVHLPPDHPEMAAAIAEARRTLDAFLAALRAAPDAVRDGCVKVRLPVEDGGHEHCWFGELEFEGDGALTGVLNNEPESVTTPKFGERIAITAADVTDWGCFRGATAEGFFTTRALLPHVKGKLRRGLLGQMGWSEELVATPGFAIPARASAGRADDEERDDSVAAAAHQFALEASAGESSGRGGAGVTLVPPVLLPPPLSCSSDGGRADRDGRPRRRYRTDLSKMTFGECRRFGHGWFKGGFYWVMTRALPPSEQSFCLPMLQTDVNAAHDDLPPAVHTQLDPKLAELEHHGFRVMRYQQLPTWFDGQTHLRGGAVALSADGRTVATVNYVFNATNPPAKREVLAIGLGAFLADGGVLWATTMAESFDPCPGSQTVSMPGADLASLQRTLDRLVRKHAGGGVMKLDDANLAAALDREDLAAFRDRVERRRLWVPAED